MKRYILSVVLFFTYSNAIYDLHKAVGRGDVEEVKRLIHNGEDIHCPEEEEGMTPLHVAAYVGRLEIVQILLNAGAEVNSRDSSGDTPLHVVCAPGRDHWRSTNDVLIVDWLLQHGADPFCTNKKGYAPIHWAVLGGYSDIVNLYVRTPFLNNINLKGPIGMTPLHLAVMVGALDIVILLVQQGNADIMSRDKDNQTPLHAMFHSGLSEYRNIERDNRIVQILVGAGSDIEAQDNEKRTPLSLAVVSGCIHAIPLLVELGADPNCKCVGGNSPLHIAAFYENVELAAMLIKVGANVNNENDMGCTPLHTAAFLAKDIMIIKYFLDSGAEVNHKDKEGKTPLYWAVNDRNTPELAKNKSQFILLLKVAGGR